jgi:hypothetical protein
MAYSLLRRPEQRTETEQPQLLQIQQADPLFATLATHTETFAQMVRERAAERLDSWLAGVLASPWRELKRFAQGLREARAGPFHKLWARTPYTPIMAAGLTDHVWALGELLLFRVPPWPQSQTL